MATNATITAVADATASTAVISANPKRTGLYLTNVSTSTCYVLLGAGTASATNYTYKLASGGELDLSNFSGRAWKGAVKAIWSADTSASMVVTELD